MLPKWYPSKLFPNEGNYIASHISTISAFRKVVVAYVHSEYPNLNKRMYHEVSMEQGFEIYRCFFSRLHSPYEFVNRVVNFMRYYKAEWYLFNIIKKRYGLPVLCHVHVMNRTALFAHFIKLRYSIPFIISEHWSGYLPNQLNKLPLYKKLLSKYLINKSEMVTCVSQELKNGLITISDYSNISVIFNSVDTGIFKPMDVPRKFGKKIILHISRLDSHPKNVPGILKAAYDLWQKRRDFEMHFIGTGREEIKQKDLASKLKLLDCCVFFHGYLKQNMVAEWINKSAFLVVFSNYESQSKVILEAFACGKPVIATNTGGIPEIVGDRGLIISPGRVDELTKAMNEMLDGKSEFYSPEELMTYVQNNASLKVIGKRFSDIYTKMGL